jgi:hypothetical protein
MVVSRADVPRTTNAPRLARGALLSKAETLLGTVIWTPQPLWQDDERHAHLPAGPPTMRNLIATALLALGLAAGSAQAQNYTLGWNPRSGDAWMDVWLSDMNRYGDRYRDPFVDELVRYHSAPRDLVVELLGRYWAPGDIYFACALAKLAGQPCRYVVDLWERDHDKGWGAMAKQLGIKPGSAEFHSLKRGMVPSYDRWGRPIELDGDLEREFPGRDQGQGKGKD